MRIVLCVTPEFHSETPPLGLAYLKASLCQKGHFVKCLNFSEKSSAPSGSNFSLSDTTEDYLKNNSAMISEWVEKIVALEPNVVGVTLWTSTKTSACALAKALKAISPKLLVIAGGPDTVASERLNDYLKYFDVIVEKEGEITICQLVEEYQNKGFVSETEGVWTLRDGQAHLTAPSGRIKDLDALPMPDFSDFDVKSFGQGFSVMFSRGCNSYCAFCQGKKYFSYQLSRSGLNVFREVQSQIRNTGCNKFVFADDSLISAATFKEFEIFCDKVLEEGMNIKWRLYGQRISPLLIEAYVKKMVAAGLKKITFGLESFSENVRKDMGKVASDQVTEQNLRLFVGLGVEVNLLMIYGYPSETDEDFEKTLTMIEKMGDHFSNIYFNCFQINSEYYDRRPGVVNFSDGKWHPFNWFSVAVDLEKRKKRFLKLIAVLNDLGRNYSIVDPCLKRVLSQWNDLLEKELLETWAKEV